MNIAIFTDSFVPQINGVVTFITDISKELSDKGHKIFIICPKYKKLKEFSYKNVKVIRIPSIPAYFYKDFRFTLPFSPKLYYKLKKEKIDIIHFHTPLTIGIQGIINSRLLNVPLIGTFHTNVADPNYLKHMRLNNKYMQRVSWKYTNYYYNRCDLITCPSEETKKELMKNNFKRTIKTISNGISFRIFDNSKYKEVKKRYNPDGKLLLFVGRIAHEKSMDYLLDCFGLVLKKLPKTKLLIVGDGPQFNEVKSNVKKLGLEKNVILTGKIEHDKFVKSSITKAADLFVTASTTETQGISTLEAQVNGVVSIGINKGGIKDIIINNYNGYLLEPGDKKGFAKRVIELLTNEKLYKKMKKNTLKEIKKHDIKKIADIWEKEYSTLINKSK